MKTYLPNLIGIFAFLALGLHSQAALIATPVTPYRSLADSPWRVAVEAGDALEFSKHTWNGCEELNPTTLPDGYGVYDDFQECTTTWLLHSHTEFVLNSSVDADDGVLDGVGHGRSIQSDIHTGGIPVDFMLSFSPTSDGKLPKWFGFASLFATPLNQPPAIDVLGVGGALLQSITLTDLNNGVNAMPFVAKFQGFISDQEITAIIFHEGLTIDHFQYGYGAGPVPEPCSLLLVGLGGIVLRRRPSLR